jgi:methionyl-tRNA formyltransferase
MRVIYFGLAGLFSVAPLSALLAAGEDVRAVVVGAPRSTMAHDVAPIRRLEPKSEVASLPILNPVVERNLVQIAVEHGIPVYELRRPRAREVQATLAAYAPDVACVACFTQRIPSTLLALPRHGFLNVHPSLLPAYRGPAPVFWALRNGDTAGVTVHFMDEGLDTGDLARQTPVDIPDGCSGEAIDQMQSMAGGRLLVDVLHDLEHGSLERRRQPRDGSMAPWPTADDFTISTEWSARRAFNFMRGTAAWGQPYPIMLGEQRLLLDAAIAYIPGSARSYPHVRSDGEILIPFADGTLHATVC